MVSGVWLLGEWGEVAGKWDEVTAEQNEALTKFKEESKLIHEELFRKLRENKLLRENKQLRS